MRKVLVAILIFALGFSAAAVLYSICQQQYVAGHAKNISANYHENTASYSVVSCFVVNGLAGISHWFSFHHDAIISFSTLGLLLVTTALAVYTALLWKETGKLAKDAAETAKKQFERMEREFIAVHRPQIIIGEMIPDFSETGERDLIGVQFLVENIGGTPAKITTFRIIEKTIRPGQYKPPIVPGNTFALKVTECIAGYRDFEKLSFEHAISLVKVNNPSTWMCELIVHGLLGYTDGNGIQRVSIFYRIYDYTSERFYKSKDTELENER